MFSYIICFLLIVYAFCKLTNVRCYSKMCLVGKTAIVTGANSGIGNEIALGLASRGCKVIIADKDDGTESRKKIVSETNNTNIITIKMDLSSFESVRKFSEYIKQTEPNVDILINNAGIGSTALVFTEDGFQTTMQVNYLGHFLLTYLLLDILKKSAPSRIIFVSSLGAFVTKFSIEDLNPRENYSSPYRTYPNSKLCEAILTKYLSEKLEGTNVTVNCFHPGGVRSGIYMKALSEETSIFPIILGLLTIPFGKSPEEGAQTGLYLACDKDIEKVTGRFFIECRQFFMPFQVHNKQLCEEVIEYSKKLVGLTQDECSI